MLTNILKPFIIGSSLPVFFYFFVRVRNISPETKDYKYEDYVLIAPLYWGIINIILSNLKSKYKHIFMGIISPLIVFTYSFITKSYVDINWFKYFMRILLAHFITINFIIQRLNNKLK